MNHTVRFTLEKSEKLLSFLENRRYSHVYRDFPISFCAGRDFDKNALEAVDRGFRWGGYDGYGWVSLQVDLPEHFHGRTVAGYFDFGKTGLGNNSGFEALCYLNGRKFQGVDINHREVLLPESCHSFEMNFMLWSGLDGGGNEASIDLSHEIKSCEFSILDPAVDELYYLLKALLQSVKLMSPELRLYHSLLEILDQTYQLIPISSEDLFYEQAQKAYEYLDESLKAMREENPDIVRCVGHTHLDVAWLWTLDHTREKAQRSFATVLRLMERYPDYIFLQTQPQIYDRLKTDAPDLYKRIKQKIREKRWEPNGAMWVEADCLLTSGESLVRQLLYGKKFFNEEFGVESNVLWLPDVFGYSPSLPQILKLADVDAFMTTKISWNQYNRIPNDTFLWRGIDGSEILTHFINTPWLDDGQDALTLDFYTYNGLVDARSVKGIWQGYGNKELSDELLISYGFGDGGGGPTREMLEMVDKLDRIPGNPQVKTGNAGDYFRKLVDTCKEKNLNVWDGELYLEFHRGTYTSQAKTKKFNRRLEYMLRNSEILALFGSLDEYPADFLEETWKDLLTRQFHDILPGSGITAVYEEAEKTYAGMEKSLRRHQIGTAAALRKGEDGLSFFNPHSFPIDRIVYVEGLEDGVLKNDQGEAVPSQISGFRKGGYVRVALPPLGFSNYQSLPIETSSGDEKPSITGDLSGSLENQRYRISWNSEGKIDSLIIKEEQKDLVTEGRLFNDLKVFEDTPRHYDAWELEPYYEDKSSSVDGLISSKIIEDGPLVSTAQFVWEYGLSRITQYLSVYSDSDRIDFNTIVDWKERNSILRTYFETDIRSTRASYDVQFGSVERNTHSNTQWDFAKYEVPGQKWADLSQRGRGLALLNDCKYGYRVKDRTMSLSLLKSSTVPDKQADYGLHEFCYSLLPHNGDLYQAGVEREAQILNNPILSFNGVIPISASLVHLNGDNILIDAVKRSEDGRSIVIRMHEFAGMEAEVLVEPSMDYRCWKEVNILERSLSPAKSGPISLVFQPFEIKTIALEI